MKALNECGSCSMCCYAYSWEDGGVECNAGKWCKHCKLGVGCQIYDDRPKTCRDYHCCYQQFPVSVSARPDKCGMVIQIVGDKVDVSVANDKTLNPLFLAHRSKDLSTNKQVSRMIEALKMDRTVFVHFLTNDIHIQLA